MGRTMIEVKDLSYQYPQGMDEEPLMALDQVTLSVHTGQFLVILGSNGSGKSTLAKHLNGMLLPTSGSCHIAGMDTRDEQYLWKIREKVGMVFQNPDNQIVAAIVEEDVAFGPENLGVEPEEIRRRVDESLAQVGMSEYSSHAPHLLSGGQKQRVAIAGVLAMHPDYLILDESTAMLDPEGRSEVLDVLRKLRKNTGITVILITHHMEEALEADRVLVMDQGKILLDGSPEAVFMQEKLIIQAGLEVPVTVGLMNELQSLGITLDEGFKLDELVESLCRLKSKN
ncbi:MAG: energy-coupling factor transporter ATPase [Negativicutes bacterium]|nr:energy-coupling factor transporter ATPase [Negativicutes bacterium]